MASSRLHTIDTELLRCHHEAQKTLIGKVLSVLQDIETRKRVCGRCRGCDGERACVCVGECWGKCSACTGCASRSLENAKRLSGLVDFVLALHNVDPDAHPVMVEIIDKLLKIIDSGRTPVR